MFITTKYLHYRLSKLVYNDEYMYFVFVQSLTCIHSNVRNSKVLEKKHDLFFKAFTYTCILSAIT